MRSPRSLGAIMATAALLTFISYGFSASRWTFNGHRRTTNIQFVPFCRSQSSRATIKSKIAHALHCRRHISRHKKCEKRNAKQDGLPA